MDRLLLYKICFECINIFNHSWNSFKQNGFVYFDSCNTKSFAFYFFLNFLSCLLEVFRYHQLLFGIPVSVLKRKVQVNLGLFYSVSGRVKEYSFEVR